MHRADQVGLTRWGQGVAGREAARTECVEKQSAAEGAWGGGSCPGGRAGVVSLLIGRIAVLPVDQHCCWLSGFCQERSAHNPPRASSVLS